MRGLTGRLAGALGMGHAHACDHPVDGARMDHLVGAEAVPVLKLTPIEIGDRAEPDMWMRAHIDTVASDELGWSRLIEKNERSDHLTLGRRQCPTHLETTEIAGTGYDQRFDTVFRPGRWAGRLQAWVPAHF